MVSGLLSSATRIAKGIGRSAFISGRTAPRGRPRGWGGHERRIYGSGLVGETKKVADFGYKIAKSKPAYAAILGTLAVTGFTRGAWRAAEEDPRAMQMAYGMIQGNYTPLEYIPPEPGAIQIYQPESPMMASGELALALFKTRHGR